LSGQGADLGLHDTWWWQPRVGGGRWWSWVAVGAIVGWQKHQKQCCRTVREQGMAILGHREASCSGCSGCPCYGSCWGVALGGSGRPNNGWKITEKANRTTCSTGEKLNTADRGRGFGAIFGSLANLMFWRSKNAIKLN